ncbi:DUF397 domain-containing protein [Nocardia sp. NPDC059240]|uniref:DUF397 domain-containing protein n=1 Tax=Nocardia sp. NPDC059240 TaxID=3346786 RepID=UPI0036CCD76A
MNIELTDAQWFKSSYSQAGGECVEVAFLGAGAVGIRDSKDSGGPALVFAPQEWDAFASSVHRGEFDAGWFKSSYSQGGQECVEVAFLHTGAVGVRDSKDAGGPALVFAPLEWDAFTSGVRSGEFG